MDKKKKIKILVGSVLGVLLIGGITFAVINSTSTLLWSKPLELPAEPDNGLTDEEKTVELLPTTEDGAELKNAKAMFPDAKAFNEWSQEDVQLASYAVFDYIHNAYNDSYFINGQWQRDGYPDEPLEKYRKAYTPEMWEEIQPSYELLRMEDPQRPTGDEIRRFTNQLLFTDFRGQEDKFKPFELCALSSFDSCLQNEQVVVTSSEIKESEDGKGLVFEVEFNAPVYYDAVDGTRGVSTFNYKTTIGVIKEGEVSESQGLKTFKIRGMNTEWARDGWVPLENDASFKPESRVESE